MEVTVGSRADLAILRANEGPVAVRGLPRPAFYRAFSRMPALIRSCIVSAVVACTSFAAVEQAMAFDEKVFDDKTGVKPQSSPWAVFQFGFSAYKIGHKDQVV